MATNGIRGITIEIGGDTTELQKALRDVDKTTRSTQRELREIDNLLKFDPTNVELLTQRQQALARTIDSTTTRLDALKQAQAEVERQFENGDIGEEEYARFRREIIATEGRLEAFQRQLQNTNERIELNVDDSQLGRARRSINALGDAAQKTGKTIARGLEVGFKAGVTGAAAVGAALVGGGAAINAFVKENEELNTSLARLRTNADVAGFSVDVIDEAFKRVVQTSGDTGASVETVSNLIQTGFSENQLLEALDSINGAAIAFSDTLKTEGIADGIQETFATGAAIGPFAELLERSGVNIEEFNAGLARAQAVGKETDYVLQALANTGLASNLSAYQENNAALIAYNQSQLEAEIRSAELAESLLPLATNYNNVKTILADIALGNISASDGFIKIRDELSGLGVAFSEFATVAIPNFIEGFINNLPQIYDTGIKVYEQLVNSIQDNLPGIVAKAIQIVSTIASTIISRLPDIIRTASRLIAALIQGILANLPNLAIAAVKLVLQLVAGIIKSLPEIVAAAGRIILALVSGLIASAFQITSYIGNKLIPSIRNAFTSFDWGSIGRNIISGLTRGITSTAKNVANAAKNAANGAFNAAKKALKIFSPSRAFRELGEFTNEGFVVGIERTAPRLERTVDNLYGSLGQSANQSIQNQQANNTFITNNNNQNTNSLLDALMLLANRPISTTVALDGRVISDTVSSNQLANQSIAAAFKGVPL